MECQDPNPIYRKLKPETNDDINLDKSSVAISSFSRNCDLYESKEKDKIARKGNKYYLVFGIKNSKYLFILVWFISSLI